MSSIAELRSILDIKEGQMLKDSKGTCSVQMAYSARFCNFFSLMSKVSERILYYSTSFKSFAIRLQRSL